MREKYPTFTFEQEGKPTEALIPFNSEIKFNLYIRDMNKNMPNATHTFWNCFEHALANNKKTPNGKRRILSIISNDFTYEELKQNLNVIFLVFFLHVKTYCTSFFELFYFLKKFYYRCNNYQILCEFFFFEKIFFEKF